MRSDIKRKERKGKGRRGSKEKSAKRDKGMEVERGDTIRAGGIGAERGEGESKDRGQ